MLGGCAFNGYPSIHFFKIKNIFYYEKEIYAFI